MPSDQVQVIKWPHKQAPTEESVAAEMQRWGYQNYDLQEVPPWFFRSRHSHDLPEIRGAVSGVTTFHFDEGPITIEAGDILIIPAGKPHEVRTHNGHPFRAYKGSTTGERIVTEYSPEGGNGK